MDRRLSGGLEVCACVCVDVVVVVGGVVGVLEFFQIPSWLSLYRLLMLTLGISMALPFFFT